MAEKAEEFRFEVAADQPADRLDRVLVNARADMSRSRLQALIRNGRVTVGGRTIVEPKYRVNAGDAVTLTIPPPEPAAPQPEAIPLTVVFEDDQMIVIDKPAGLVVHPGAGTPDGTLVNALLHHCVGSLSGIGGVERPGIVHRLDKDTSGLIVAAKTDLAHRSLADQFADHGRTGPLERGYRALVWGCPRRPRGTVDAPIGRSRQAPEKMIVREGGRRAVTRYTVMEPFAAVDGATIAALVECRLETGRTHQIRVHMAHLRHPILGDPVYAAGFRSKERLLTENQRFALNTLGTQALHAYLLQVSHPVSAAVLRFESAFPPAFQALVDALKRDV